MDEPLKKHICRETPVHLRPTSLVICHMGGKIDEVDDEEKILDAAQTLGSRLTCRTSS